VQTFETKVGDTVPAIETTLLRADGSPADLTLATDVEFVMALDGAADAKVHAAAEFVDKPAGLVRYPWDPADVDTELEYLAEWVVTWPGGGTTRFPRPGFDRVHFERALP
jgi:hypothetical protein